jgi:hypothetical protein
MHNCLMPSMHTDTGQVSCDWLNAKTQAAKLDEPIWFKTHAIRKQK